MTTTKDRTEYFRQYRIDNRERFRERDRAWHLKSRYGMTPEEWDAQLALQDGHCATCPSTKKLSVDHNHVTGAWRAILCHLCNVTVGYAEEDPERLRALADYLERWQ